MVHEVGGRNEESDWFDARLLTKLAALKSIFTDQLPSLTLPAGRTRTAPHNPSLMDHSLVEAASSLGRRTPPSRQVRLLGHLDMIRRSTRSFGLKLDDGSEVRGVVDNPALLAHLADFFDKRVLVHGRAVYRASGRLLRIDTAAMEAGEGQPELFCKVPPPMKPKPSVYREHAADVGKRGVAALLGTWPGEETAADFERMLKEIRT